MIPFVIYLSDEYRQFEAVRHLCQMRLAVNNPQLTLTNLVLYVLMYGHAVDNERVFTSDS